MSFLIDIGLGAMRVWKKGFTGPKDKHVQDMFRMWLEQRRHGREQQKVEADRACPETARVVVLVSRWVPKGLTQPGSHTASKETLKGRGLQTHSSCHSPYKG